MLQQYISQPEAVEVHKVGKSTDIILRQNIAQATRTDDESEGSYEVWECEEK